VERRENVIARVVRPRVADGADDLGGDALHLIARERYAGAGSSLVTDA
jgi:hypothetical protein